VLPYLHCSTCPAPQVSILRPWRARTSPFKPVRDSSAHLQMIACQERTINLEGISHEIPMRRWTAKLHVGINADGLPRCQVCSQSSLSGICPDPSRRRKRGKSPTHPPLLPQPHETGYVTSIKADFTYRNRGLRCLPYCVLFQNKGLRKFESANNLFADRRSLPPANQVSAILKGIFARLALSAFFFSVTGVKPISE
jgi:hypothetical protein